MSVETPPGDDRTHEDERLDEELEETFPASDPPGSGSITPPPPAPPDRDSSDG